MFISISYWRYSKLSPLSSLPLPGIETKTLVPITKKGRSQSQSKTSTPLIGGVSSLLNAATPSDILNSDISNPQTNSILKEITGGLNSKYTKQPMLIKIIIDTNFI